MTRWHGRRRRRRRASRQSRSGRSRTTQRISGSMPPHRDEIEGHFRREYGRCVATLVRFLGDIDLAEEAVQEAFVVALDRWPAAGVPPNPGGWITMTARNRAIDQLRREASRHDRHAQAALLYPPDEPAEPVGPVKDD